MRQDSISYGLSGLSVILLLFMATFGADIMALAVFVVVILLASIVMSERFNILAEDESIDESESKEILVWAFGSFVVILLLNYFVQSLPLNLLSPLVANVAPESRRLIFGSLSILIAVSEEQFFRSFILNLTSVNITMQIVAPLVSGLTFMLYHFAVYGTSIQNLLIVFMAGSFLAYGASRTRRVSPFIASHMLNNLLSILR